LWADLHAQWDEEGSKVELRIREEELRRVSIDLLNTFPVIDYSTEKLPIERVMKALVSNPELLPG
jgi:ABC-2 type transport system ATP-binding protein